MYVIMFSKRKSDLKSAYYQLQFYILVTDFLSYLNSNASNRLPNYGVLRWVFENFRINQTDIRIVNFIAYTTLFSQYIGVVFLSLNRFTAIYLTFSYERVWKYLLPISVLMIYLIPLIFTWPYLCNLTVYRFLWDDDGEGGYNITTKENNCVFFPQSIVTTTFSFGCSSLAAIFNILSLAYIIKDKGIVGLFKCDKNIIQNKYEYMKLKSERNMLFCTIFSFIFGLLFGICSQLLANFAAQKNFFWFRVNCMAISFLYDLTSLSKCWMLLLSSTTIREELKRIFYLKRKMDTTLFTKQSSKLKTIQQ
uniref:Serpentine receptor class gamma n=1 Tax=Parastrongyloides trichosuri TaxID=131310 RepID=A0A0N4Z6U3_PARTI